MSRKGPSLAALLAAVFVSGFAHSADFKHSTRAKLLYKQHEAAVACDGAKQARETLEIQMRYSKSANERNQVLIDELNKVLEFETMNGNLDAALEVREAIASLNAPSKTVLSPSEIRQRLVGTSWIHDVEQNEGSWFRFNADGTITASWHDLPSMWAVLPDGSVQMLFTKNREIRRMRVDPTFQSGVSPDGKGWKYRRLR